MKNAKILSLFLALCLVFSLGAFASAEPSGEASAEGAYPFFDEYKDYVAAYVLADDFMSGSTPAYEDTYAAETPYGTPFVDINPVIGAMDYPDWMGANHPGVTFPTA